MEKRLFLVLTLILLIIFISGCKEDIIGARFNENFNSANKKPLVYFCDYSSLIGDINGDKELNENDFKILEDMYEGLISLPSNICCIDLSKDGVFDEKDLSLFYLLNNFQVKLTCDKVLEDYLPNNIIVKLSEPSIIEKNKDLIKQINELENNNQFQEEYNNLKTELNSKNIVQKNLIEQEQNRIVFKISNSFPKASVTKRVNAVLNALVIENFSIADCESFKFSNTEIRECFPDNRVQSFLNSSIPFLGVDSIWPLQDGLGNNLTGVGIKVGVIDTGIDYTHPDLGNGCFGAGCKVEGGFDFVNNDSDPIDDFGHGTHCAGIIAGEGLIYRGVAPDAKLYAYKVLNNRGGGSMSDIIAAVEMSVDPNQDANYSDHLDVISLSLGFYNAACGLFDEVFENVNTIGVIPIVSAGNAGSDGLWTMGCPAYVDNAISVGSVTHLENSLDTGGINKRAYYSSRGPNIYGKAKPDILAPGGDKCNTCDPGHEYDYGIISAASPNVYNGSSSPYIVDNNYIRLTGTSMAGPHVAGAVALIKQMHPDWDFNDIKYTLRGTAESLGGSIFEEGAGKINILGAINSEEYPVARLNLNQLISQDITDIVGDAFTNVDIGITWRLYYSEGFDTQEWIEIASSTNEIFDGLIYRFDTSIINFSYFTLKLDVVDDEGRVSEDQVVLLKRGDGVKSGWPIQTINDNLFHEFSPVNADLTGDGDQEIILLVPGWSEGMIYVWNIDGTLKPGWPKKINAAGGSTPAIGDVDGNGDLEIVAQVVSFSLYARGSYLYVFNEDGEPINSAWPKTLPYNIATESSPVLGDIDGDGKEEIIVNSLMGEGIRIYNEDGSEIIGPWNHYSYTYDNLGLAVGDLDEDGMDEIVFADSINKMLYIWNGDGSNFGSFPIYLTTDNLILLSPTILNADSDYDYEIIIGNYIYNLDGSILTKINFDSSLIRGNLGVRIVVFPELVTGDRDKIQLSYFNGINKTIFSVSTYMYNIREIISADVTGDRIPEILFTVHKAYSPGAPDNFLLYAIDLEGKVISGYPKKMGDYQSELLQYTKFVGSKHGLLAGDFDNDGKNEIAVVFFSGDNFQRSSIGTLISVIETDGLSEANPWPMHLKDTKHSSYFIKQENCSYLSCYRILGDINNNNCLEKNDLELIGEMVYQGREIDACADITRDCIVDSDDYLEFANHINSCTDCTTFKNCSVQKPLYCENGNLVSKCQICGCFSSEFNCTETGKCSLCPAESIFAEEGEEILNQYCSNSEAGGGFSASSTDWISLPFIPSKNGNLTGISFQAKNLTNIGLNLHVQIRNNIIIDDLNTPGDEVLAEEIIPFTDLSSEYNESTIIIENLPSLLKEEIYHIVFFTESGEISLSSCVSNMSSGVQKMVLSPDSGDTWFEYFYEERIYIKVHMGFGSYAIEGSESCCGDNSGEYLASGICCDSLNDYILNGNCVPRQRIPCGSPLIVKKECEIPVSDIPTEQDTQTNTKGIETTSEPTLKKCEDNTLINECSITQPLYCNEDIILIEDCVKCGCNTYEECDTITNTCYTKEILKTEQIVAGTRGNQNIFDIITSFIKSYLK